MPCACSSNLCNGCACGKANKVCGPSCHGGAGLGGNECCLNTVEGRKANAMPLAEVRKTLARAGLDVIGNANELKRRLADFMLSNASPPAAEHVISVDSEGEGAQPAAAYPSSSSRSSSNSELIAATLACGDDYASVLSLSGFPITKQSPVAEMRRAYLKLSVRLHPDKNSGSSEAKQAFQAVVLSLERLSQPSAEEDATSSSSSATAARRERVDTSLTRSNANCVQTRVYCPRCHMDWPRKELGLEEGAYNFFMSALKEYCCGRCMCVFGCMTAEHECPGCRRAFEYSPADYHRHIRCGNAGCSREFGFMQYPVSARRLAEVRKELHAAQEERMKRAEANARRQNRARARDDVPAAAPGSSSSSSGGRAAAAGAGADPEKLFKLHLVEECPRCGMSIADLDEDESPAQHLGRCNDKRAHAAHAAVVRAAAQRKAAVATKAEAAEDASALARWTAGGRVVSSLWVLPGRVLSSLCREAGLDEGGSKFELVRRYAGHCRAMEAKFSGQQQKLLMDAPAAASSSSSSSSRGGAAAASSSSAAAARHRRVDVSGISTLDAFELPSNLHALEAEQLACVCAACGLPGEPGHGKAALIRILERARHKGNEEAAGLKPFKSAGALEDGARGRGAQRLMDYKEASSSEEGDDDDDDDGDGEAELDFVDDDDDAAPGSGGRRRKAAASAGKKRPATKKARA